MRVLTAISVLVLFYCVYCKNNVKALTESMGQEVIEIGTPVKELPPELDEEPSAEVDDDNRPASTSLPPAAKKKPDTRRRLKDVDVDEAEDARIEKELAEIYKDNAEYKDEEVSSTTTAKVNITEKPALRAGSKAPVKHQSAAKVENQTMKPPASAASKNVTKILRHEDPVQITTRKEVQRLRKPANNGVTSLAGHCVFIATTLFIVKTSDGIY